MAHILIPTDFSERSLKAAKLVIDLLGAEGHRFTLIHAYVSGGLNDPFVPGMSAELQGVNEDGLNAFEKQLRGACDLSKADVRSVVSFGPLSAVINEIDREQKVDLLVMSSRGKQGPTLFGSNTTGVIQGTRIPVLEIPEHVEELKIRRILFADDRSEIKPGTLETLSWLASLTKAEVIIGHVATGRSSVDLVDNTDLLERVFAGIPHRRVVVENDNVEEALMDLAATASVDLIALVHRHGNVWQELFRHSTTKELALDASLPLLAMEQ